MSLVKQEVIKVVTQYNSELIEQSIVGFNFDKLTKQILDLREEGTRKALIDLGWTPPAPMDI